MVVIFSISHAYGLCIIGSSCNDTGNAIDDGDVTGNYSRSEGGLLHKLNEAIVDVEEKVKIVDFHQIFDGAGQHDQQCHCGHYTCGCCAHLEEPEIRLNSTICANATYLSEDIGITLTVTVNSYTIFNKTVSVRNPPPVCLGLPYVKEWAEACVQIYDIDTTTSRLHACIRVEARMKLVLIAKYELGCFTIGPHAIDKFRYNVSGNSNITEPIISVILV